MAFDAATLIEERARQIKMKIEKTKNDIVLTNDIIAMGRSHLGEMKRYSVPLVPNYPP